LNPIFITLLLSNFIIYTYWRNFILILIHYFNIPYVVIKLIIWIKYTLYFNYLTYIFTQQPIYCTLYFYSCISYLFFTSVPPRKLCQQITVGKLLHKSKYFQLILLTFCSRTTGDRTKALWLCSLCEHQELWSGLI